MRSSLKSIFVITATVLVVIVAALSSSPSSAHLMPAQKGTINIAGDGGFLVLSVPVTAFAEIDDDGDGKLSQQEMQVHYADIERQVLAGLLLRDGTGLRPLQGLLLNLSPPDSAPGGAAPQLVVLGRFLLATPDAPMRLQIALFGKAADERVYHVTGTRGEVSQLVVFTPERIEHQLFASAWTVFADYVALGTWHILAGFDHLLFLLVVLAAGWNWRQVLGVLTCFTLGHFVTLAISVWGVVRLPPVIVEPAIAATIVVVAIYDLLQKRRFPESPQSTQVRMALVFGCALIHGLGLSSTLIEFGLDSQHRVISLAGFNVGVEIGQIGVALMFGFCVRCIANLPGPSIVTVMTQTATYLGIAIGAAWFIQRVAEGI